MIVERLKAYHLNPIDKEEVVHDVCVGTESKHQKDQ